MSAIFGIIHRDGKPVSREDLGKMDAALEAFGPDGHGIWCNGHIGLGQREMHFTPEDRFNQLPLKSADGLRVLVCDARVDNRPELMHLLDIRPTDAKEMPDSAFIMQAYEKWGEDCVKHLIGDICFALWDQREHQLLLARSPIGGRSMYYYVSPDLFAFSTMPKGLFALSAIPRELDMEYVAGYLARTGTCSDKFFYSNINNLHPGNAIKISHKIFQKFIFWNTNKQEQLRYANDEQYVEAFNFLFERSVSDRLRSLTPIGIMMSGGLDSTSVAAVAASQLKNCNKRLTSFTEVPPPEYKVRLCSGKYADETPYVQSMAQQYDNLDINFIRTDGHLFLEEINQFFNASDIPFKNSSNRVWIEAILRQAKNQGIRVLLTGSQGNFTISRNGNTLLPQLIRSGKILQALREATAMHQKCGSNTPFRNFIGQGIIPLLPPPLWIELQRMRGKSLATLNQHFWRESSPINPLFAKSQKLEDRSRRKVQNNLYKDRLNHLNVIIKRLLHTAFLTNNIDQAYRSLFGIEIRDPTADIRLVEFCMSLPEDQYQKNGVSRRLIRRAMSDRLPSMILENKQRGFQASDWFERLQGSRNHILLTLDDWSTSELVPTILDLKRMKHLAENMSTANTSFEILRNDYQMVLEFGLMIGSFVRWFENGGK